MLRTGYGAASLSAVAGRLGVTKGALTYQFPTKQALVAALVDHFESVLAHTQDRLDALGPVSATDRFVATLLLVGSQIRDDELTGAATSLLADRAAPRQEMQRLLELWTRWLEPKLTSAGLGRSTASGAADLALFIAAVLVGSAEVEQWTTDRAGEEDYRFLRLVLAAAGVDAPEAALARVLDDVLRVPKGELPIVGLPPH